MVPTGRTVALLAGAAGGALWVPPGLAVAIVVAVLVAAALDARSVRRPPEVERTVAPEVVRGAGVPLLIDVAAPAPRRVRVRQPQTEDLRVDPAEGEGGLVATLVAGRRGRHLLPPVVTRTTGPLGLAAWTHQHGVAVEVAAHPDLPGGRRIARAVQQGRFRDPGRRRGPLGLGTEFESVREYAPDDDVRRINWKATERVGRPMVNQHREDTERDVWCLIDAGRLLASPAGDRTRLDVALDAVAAVASVADVVGDRVGAVAFDDRVRSVHPPRRASARPLLRALDDLEPRVVDTDFDAAFATVAGQKRAMVVLFTDLLDAAAARPLLAAVPVLARRHAVVVATVADADLQEAIARAGEGRRRALEASVAADLLAERSAVVARLVAAGAVVAEAPAAELPSACVGAYLRLKARARL